MHYFESRPRPPSGSYTAAIGPRTLAAALATLTTAALLTTPTLAAAQATTPPASTRPGQDSTALRIEGLTITGSRAPAIAGGAAAIVVRPDSLPVPMPPAPELADILRQSAFVTIRQNSRGEMEISMRGSESRQPAIMLDGLPLSIGWDSRTDLSITPTTGVEQLVLVRGLSSLLYGPNTLGGTVQMTLNGPPGSSTMEPNGPGVHAGLGFDQFSGRVLSATAAAPVTLGNGTLRLRAGVTNRQRDGFALAGGDPGDGISGGQADPGSDKHSKLRTNTDLSQTDGFVGLRYDMRAGAYLSLTGTTSSAERGVAPEQHVSSPRYWRYPDLSRSLGIFSAGSGVRSTPLGSGSLNMSAGVSVQDITIDSYGDRSYSTVSSVEKGYERTQMLRVEGNHSLPAAALLKLAGTFNSVAYDETLNAQQAASKATRYEQRLSSMGAEVELPLQERVLVSGGVVFDQASTPETGGRTSLGTLNKTGWRLGTTVMANEGLRFHASASQRARFPALRELYSGALNRFDPNPELKPETLLGFEGGMTLDGGIMAQKGLRLQVVGFRHLLDDAVVRVTLPNKLFRRINRDEIRSAGVELVGTWAPPSLKGASITADATIQKVRVHDQTVSDAGGEGQYAEHVPERRGSLTLSSPEISGFRASLMGRYTGVQYCEHPDLNRQVKLDPQTVTDASVSKDLNLRDGFFRKLRAFIAMDNITNRTVYDQCGMPQPGRTFRVGFTIN